MKEIRDQNNSSQQALNKTAVCIHDKDNSSSDLLRENIQKQLRGNLDFAGNYFYLQQSYSSQKDFLTKINKTLHLSKTIIYPLKIKNYLSSQIRYSIDLTTRNRIQVSIYLASFTINL